MARTLAYLYFANASLALAGVVVPHGHASSVPGLLVLIEAAQRVGATLVLENAPGTAARLIQILKLSGVRVQARR